MNMLGKLLEINGQKVSELSKQSKEINSNGINEKEIDKPMWQSFKDIDKSYSENTKETNEQKNLRPLTKEEREHYQDILGWTDNQMDKCTIDEDGHIHYKCDNEHFEGKVHEPSGVLYIRKTVEINGVLVEVVVPDFKSEFDVDLAKELHKESNPKQFKECNEQLKEAIQKDENLRSKFTDEQIKRIMGNKFPEGYTWHHDAEEGKMRLVKTSEHDRAQGGAAHTGGKALWGGGY